MIVDAAPHPLAMQVQVVLAGRQQVIARHQAAREEVAAHPVRGTLRLEPVGIAAVAEDWERTACPRAWAGPRCAA